MATTATQVDRSSSRTGSTVTRESSSRAPSMISPATADISAEEGSQDEKKESLTPVTQAAATPTVDLDERQGPVLLSGFTFWAMYFCMLLSILLVALDVTLVSTAQTVIVADLGGVTQISWVVTAFLLTQASFMLFYGQVLSNFPSKACYLSAIVFFEVGSLICAVAQDMNTLIVGRAIAGIGASGIMISAMTILAESTTLQQRASLMGGLGVVFGVSMVLGPLIGGAIAQHIGWRWCFYINLPAGGLTIASIVFLLKTHPPLGQLIHKPMPLKEKINRLDFVGLLISLGWLVAITLPLQDGGIKYPWTDGRILGPLIASVFILALLVAWCGYRGREHALIPLALLKDRNLVGCSMVSCFCYLAVLVNIYYLPRFYQAVFGSSPTKSGVDLLPSVVAMSLVSFLGGVFAGKTGHYYTQMAISPLFGIAGSAMLYRINHNTSQGYLIGAQILVGIAMGACIQSPILAAQANVKRQLDISRAVGIVTFVQRVGGTIGNGIASGVFFSFLPQELSRNSVPAEYASKTLNQPETLDTFPAGAIQDGAKQAFARATANVLVIGVPAMVINLLLILLLIKCTNLRTKRMTPISQMLAIVLAALTGRSKSTTASGSDAEHAGKDVEKADEATEQEVEEEIVVASMAVPDMAKEGEATLDEDVAKRA